MLGYPRVKNNGLLTRNHFEEMMCRKRCKEADRQLECKNNLNYFNTSTIRAEKEKQWSSDKFFDHSMKAYVLQKDKNLKSDNLDIRRARLRKLLEKDAENYKIELEKLTEKSKNQNELLVQAKALKQARELEKSQLAEKLLTEHFRRNNPDLRKLKQEIESRRTVDTWNLQKEEQKEIENSNRIEEILNEEMQNEAANLAYKKADELEMASLQAKQNHLEHLQKQLDELHLRENKADCLAQTEKELIGKLVELEKLENDRRTEKERVKRELYGRALLRQHHAALRRRSNLIQTELKNDLNWLSQLANQEQDERHNAKLKKMEEMNQWRAMKQMIEAELSRERQMQLEMDQLQADEASKIWQKREQEWRNESEARQKLMNEVLEERRKQIADQLAQNQQLQREELESREALLESLDEHKRMNEMETELTRQKQRDQNRFLDLQVKEKAAKSQEDRERILKDEELLHRTEMEYVKMLRQEAEKMKMDDNYLNNSKNVSKLNGLMNSNRISRRLW